MQTTSTGWGERSPLLLGRGYRFLEGERRDPGQDVVRLRLMGRPAFAVRGQEAARFFYTEPSLRRGGALPELVVGSLFGHGAVHTLDGADHQHRKDLLNALTGPSATAQVCAALATAWDTEAPHWRGRVDLFAEVSRMLMRAGCGWVGLPLPDDEVAWRTAQLVAMVDGFGSVGRRQLRARLARRRTESWVMTELQRCRLVSRDRSDGTASDRSPLEVVAAHRDRKGQLLPLRTAAVEVLNLVRPLVAVSWLVGMAAMALDSFPEQRRGLVDGTVDAVAFAQEVRRTYPFVPVLGARATADVRWRDVDVPAGSLVLLDVWGTNHDPRLWPEPDTFDPSRFERQQITPFSLVPQGGGSAENGHRCPGEDLTLGVLVTLAPRLAASDLTVVSGLGVGLQRMPPEPRFVVSR